MTVLVIGGTGTVGANLVERLARSGEEEIRVLTRDSERARGQLPKEVELAEGNLLDPYATRRHFFGVDRLFLSVAAGPAETQEGLTAIELARRADVTKVVYMSTHHVERTPAMPVGGGTKLPIENAIKASGMGYTILRPNSFLQNDRWYLPTMLDRGLYCQPIGLVGMSRIDVRDIADAATTALTQDGFEGRAYSLVGPDVQTGPSIAAAWSAGLGRDVVYVGDDLGEYERNHSFNPPHIRFSYGLFFEFYQRNGLIATKEELSAQEELIRHPPRTLAGYVGETVAELDAGRLGG